MSENLTYVGKEKLLKSIAVLDADNPFIKDNGKLYCKFDSIKMTYYKKYVHIGYYWKNEEIWYQTIDFLTLFSDSIIITGLEGRSKIEVSFA